MSSRRVKADPAPLVIFGEDWGSHPSSTQHLARRLMADRSVVWVNSIGLRRPRISDAGRVVRKIRAMIRGASRSVHEGRGPIPAALIQPKAVSWPGNPIAAAVNRRTLPRQINAALASIGESKPILWTSLPSAVDVVGALDEVAVIYYAGDDFGALAGVDHRPVIRQEARLADLADIVITASPEIAKRFPPGKTFVIPHGVDLDLFAHPVPRAEDMPDTGRPIAGFYGALDDWLDTQMLARTARLRPDWDFVLIGPERTDVSALKSLPNVRLLGARPHAELPRYSQHWQAALLPFKDTAQIRACNPLKLREYAAAGAPIISTDFPAARRFSDHIYFAADSDAFSDALQECLSEPEIARDKRRRSVENQSWGARANEVRILIEALQNGTPVSE